MTFADGFVFCNDFLFVPIDYALIVKTSAALDRVLKITSKAGWRKPGGIHHELL